MQSGPRPEGPDFGDEAPFTDDDGDRDRGRTADGPPRAAVELVRPFAELEELPDDLSAAFETFKLAILRHKMDDWQQVSRDDVLASLEALKQLVVAPSPDRD